MIRSQVPAANLHSWSGFGISIRHLVIGHLVRVLCCRTASAPSGQSPPVTPSPFTQPAPFVKIRIDRQDRGTPDRVRPFTSSTSSPSARPAATRLSATGTGIVAICKRMSTSPKSPWTLTATITSPRPVIIIVELDVLQANIRAASTCILQEMSA